MPYTDKHQITLETESTATEPIMTRTQSLRRRGLNKTKRNETKRNEIEIEAECKSQSKKSPAQPTSISISIPIWGSCPRLGRQNRINGTVDRQTDTAASFQHIHLACHLRDCTRYTVFSLVLPCSTHDTHYILSCPVMFESSRTASRFTRCGRGFVLDRLSARYWSVALSSGIGAGFPDSVLVCCEAYLSVEKFGLLVGQPDKLFRCYPNGYALISLQAQ